MRIARSPGMKYRHYAPVARVHLVLDRPGVEKRVEALAGTGQGGPAGSRHGSSESIPYTPMASCSWNRWARSRNP